MGTAEQVYLTIIDNLKEVLLMLKSADAIDLEYIEEKLRGLSAESPEYKSLLQRRDLKSSQVLKIQHYLSLNEQAMTKLDATALAIASVRTQKGQADQELEQTMYELESIAQSAKKYEYQQ